MIARTLACALALASPAVARAQDHAGHHMPQPQPQPQPTQTDTEAQGTDLPPGSAPAPAAPMPHAADRYWGAEAMAKSRAAMMRDEGGTQTFALLMLDQLEWQPDAGRDGYRWRGEAWFGGDRDRLVLSSEGEGAFGRAVGDAEVQALFSRAIDPYFNLRAGVRQDLGPGARRTWATIAIEGLAPYWFEIGGAAFVSTKGEVTARLEGYYDQRITQRLILQPRVEANLSAQRIAETGTGGGLSSVEAGLRLRYELRREFAPYVGVNWERRLGATADMARARGDGTGGIALVAGVRAWF